MKYNQNGIPFKKIVYIQVTRNGKVELQPVELYADHSLKQGR